MPCFSWWGKRCPKLWHHHLLHACTHSSLIRFFYRFRFPAWEWSVLSSRPGDWLKLVFSGLSGGRAVSQIILQIYADKRSCHLGVLSAEDFMLTSTSSVALSRCHYKQSWTWLFHPDQSAVTCQLLQQTPKDHWKGQCPQLWVPVAQNIKNCKNNLKIYFKCILYGHIFCFDSFCVLFLWNILKSNGKLDHFNEYDPNSILLLI